MADTHPDIAWFVRIDRWHPTRLNVLLNAHWAERNRLKKRDYNIIGLSALGAGVPKATRKRRVSLIFVMAPRQRRFDPDSPWKVVLDALVNCGALVNDSPNWCELGTVIFERGKTAATVIKIEDVCVQEKVWVGTGEEGHFVSMDEKAATKKAYRLHTLRFKSI